MSALGWWVVLYYPFLALLMVVHTRSVKRRPKGSEPDNRLDSAAGCLFFLLLNAPLLIIPLQMYFGGGR